MTPIGNLSAQNMLDDTFEVQEDVQLVALNPFAEEAARVLASAPVSPGWARGVQPRKSLLDHPAPIIEPHEHPGRPRHAWPWAMVIVVILGLAGAAYLLLADRDGAPSLAVVPAVVGLSESDAVAKLQAVGFDPVKQGVQPSADVAEGMIVRQDPQESGKLQEGKTVGYWVSSGDGLIAVPNVVGISQEKAAAELRTAGLDVSLKAEVSAAQPVGTVLRQYPDATQQVDAGIAVAITVAAAANTVAVPLLTGMSDDVALAALESMGLAGTVREVASQLDGGTVLGQDPAPGTEVQPGSSVTVDVSNAPRSNIVMVPAVAALGLTRSQAEATLAKYGLKARVVYQETADCRAGLCIYQRPAAGIQSKIGGSVTIVVSRVPKTTTTVPVAPAVSPPPT